MHMADGCCLAGCLGGAGGNKLLQPGEDDVLAMFGLDDDEQQQEQQGGGMEELPQDGDNQVGQAGRQAAGR